MKRMHQWLGAAAIAAAGWGGGVAASATTPDTTYETEKVYIYNGTWNGRHDNGYNNDAWYWSMQEACLLDENGLWPRDEPYDEDQHPTPPPVAVNGTHVGDVLLNRAGEVIGFELVDENGSGPIGYTTVDGSKIVYNLNEWSLVEIYARHPNVPSVTISKHGMPGFVALDNGRYFPGFTGAPYPCWNPNGPQPPGPPPVPGPPAPGGGTTPGPYPLPNNGTGTTELFVNSCNSNVPFPGGNSVTGSANGVPGVSATGNDGIVYKPMTIRYCAPPGMFTIIDLLSELEERTGISGEAAILAHLQAMRPDELSGLLHDVEDSIGGTFKCSASKGPTGGGQTTFDVVWNPDLPGEILDILLYVQGYYACPVPIESPGGAVRYDPPSGLSIRVDIPRDAITGRSMVYVAPVALDEMLPAGLTLMTLPFIVQEYDLTQKLVLEKPATMMFQLNGEPEHYLGLVFQAEGGGYQWIESEVNERGLVTATIVGACGGRYIPVGIQVTSDVPGGHKRK